VGGLSPVLHAMRGVHGLLRMCLIHHPPHAERRPQKCEREEQRKDLPEQVHVFKISSQWGLGKARAHCRFPANIMSNCTTFE
jgi:hypothetical protein